jgi:site-specific DNA-methyltransferase (adenine-specific)
MWVVVDTTMHEGDLQLLPFHVAEDAQSEGFKLRDVIVWYKPTSMGGLNPNMVVNKKEYVVYLSKGNSPKVRTEIPSDNGLEDPAITENGDLGNLWRFPVKRGSLGNNILHKAPFPVGLAKRMIRISTDPWDKVLDPFLGSGTTACAARALSRQWVGYEINRDFERVIRDRLDQVEPAERNTSA